MKLVPRNSIQGGPKSRPVYYCNNFVHCQLTFIFVAHAFCAKTSSRLAKVYTFCMHSIVRPIHFYICVMRLNVYYSTRTIFSTTLKCGPLHVSIVYVYRDKQRIRAAGDKKQQKDKNVVSCRGTLGVIVDCRVRDIIPKTNNCRHQYSSNSRLIEYQCAVWILFCFIVIGFGVDIMGTHWE